MKGFLTFYFVAAAAAVVLVVVEIVSHTVLPVTCSDQPSRPVLDLFTPGSAG